MYWTMGWDPGRNGYHGVALLNEDKALLDEDRVDGLEAGYQKLLEYKAWAQQAGCSLQIAFEGNDSIILEKLHQWGVRDLYNLVPRKVEAYKNAFSLGGDKSDELDAYTNGCYLMDWRGQLKLYRPPKPLEKEAEAIAAELDQIRDQKTKMWEKFWAIVDRITPKIKGILLDKETPWFLAVFIELMGKMKNLGYKGFEKFCRKRGALIGEDRLRRLHAEVKLLDREIGHPRILSCRAQQIRFLVEEKKVWEKEAGRVLCQWEDAWILHSVPGVGPATQIRLVAHLGLDWSRHTPDKISRYGGVAPVLRASGVPDEATLLRMPRNKRRRLHISRGHRLACNKNLKTTLCNFALYSMAHNAWALYAYKRFTEVKGQSHWEAIRNLSIKWLRIFCAMMRDKKRYDSYFHERNIMKRMDPLMARRTRS